MTKFYSGTLIPHENTFENLNQEPQILQYNPIRLEYEMFDIPNHEYKLKPRHRIKEVVIKGNALTQN